MKKFLPFLIFFISVATTAVSQENQKNGEKIYTEQCVLCHGPAGEGWDWEKKAAKPPVPVPDLLEVLPQRSDEYLQTVIKFGGRAVGLTDFMPALGFNLTEQEIQDLISYLRDLKQKTSSEGSLFKKPVYSKARNLQKILPLLIFQANQIF